MAAKSSSSAPPEAAERSPKAKRQIHVSLTSIRVQGDRDGVMFCIRGFKVNKKHDSKKMPISTRYIYESEDEAKADVTLFRWYRGEKTNEPGEPAMPEPWDPDWICKPRVTVSRSNHRIFGSRRWQIIPESKAPEESIWFRSDS